MKNKKNFLVDYDRFFQHETIIFFGVLIAGLSFLNVIKITNIPSDFFWTLAGLGLIVDGLLSKHKSNQNRKELLERDKMFLVRRK